MKKDKSICDCCGLVIGTIPKYKQGECSENHQHEFQKMEEK